MPPVEVRPDPPAVRDCPRLQDGIHFRKGERPGACYRLLLLNIEQEAMPLEAKNAIAAVWTLLQDLRRGIAPELEHTPIPTGDLTCLLGFGARLFDRLWMLRRPEGLSRLGDPPFPGIPWAAGEGRQVGEADLAIQLIAETDLAVDRAVVEVCMLIKGSSLPLEFVTFHGGFNRDDRRSWLGFHDGINNIEPSQRATVIETTSGGTPWMESGTYMGFLRLAIDLERWRSLSRANQELLVGRDKLSGCPLDKMSSARVPEPPEECPRGNSPPGSDRFISPPRPSADVLAASHMHRANKTRGEAGPGENRIFRQGYEFVEARQDGRLRLGLNFVSFQRSLTHLTRILTLPGWLCPVNFGGLPAEPAAISFVSLIAGGYYAVPPRGEPFPGADLL